MRIGPYTTVLMIFLTIIYLPPIFIQVCTFLCFSLTTCTALDVIIEGSQWWQTMSHWEREMEERDGGGRDRRFHCYSAKSVEDSNKHWISGCLAAGSLDAWLLVLCAAKRNPMVQMQHHNCMHIKWIVHPKIMYILVSLTSCGSNLYDCTTFVEHKK